MEIYVPGIGQYDNIGDIILRRQLLKWLEPLGRLHVFVGNAPAGYAESLVGEDHVVYRSFAAWYRAALADAVRGKAAYVFKPGEIQITFAGLKEHLSMLPLLVALKLRRKPVIRVGAGSRGFEPIPKLLMQPSLAMTDLVTWRDARTADFLGGTVMPDLAFGEGEAEPRGKDERPVLVVSMRSDRPLPSDEWFGAVRSFAQQRDLEIVSVVQVERDAERSRLLAERLGGRYHAWSGDDHEGHEQQLRELYRKTTLAVSDRLHVLITAVTEGAAPIAPLVDDSDKIDRHFSAAGISHVSIRTRGLTERVIREALAEATDNWPKVQAALFEARTQLSEVQDRVTLLLRPDLAPAGTTTNLQPTVWHVGRKGEIAGGMTQVVNAYLSWPFGNVRQRLLVSRNGKKGLSGIALFTAALVRTPFLGRRGRTVVAVHLSQKGSFVREGLILRFAKLLRYPTVAHLHGSSFVSFAEGSPALVRRTLGAADVVVALSEETRDAVVSLLPDARVTLVPNAVPEGREREKEQLVVFGGGVTRRKGVDVLVEAWKLADPGAGWELHIAGPILESDLVTDLPDGVRKQGALEHDALMTLLERSTIAVLPSRDEAMPMFVLEALARKNAVISTPVGGIPRVLGDGAGVLVAPGDADELAAALRALMDDAEQRSTVSAAGYDRFASEFSAEAVYPKVEELWLSVLD
ncbi:glycosyltransferase [Microbacterium sp. B2969]|uniref:Glycosyltransferase n=1 Tax=Microbacterium alkaliflavum TaxID=3248839 RepID=A0ABW7QCC0_9MICO